MTTPELRTFDAFVRAQNDGGANSHLSAELKDLLQALYDHQRDQGGTAKATMTVKFAFELDRTGKLVIAYSVATSTPKVTSPDSVYYLSPDGNLTQHNPNQRDMFRDVTGGADEARAV